MTQQPFAPITNEPFKVQNYFMRIILTQLNRKKLLTTKEARYNFSIFKGYQQIQTTGEIIVPSGSTGPIPLQKFNLNFNVTSYNPGKTHDFALRMTLLIDQRHAREIGQHIIQANQFIDQYHMTQNGAFVLTVDLNDQFSADLELYVDNNQHGLFRLIKEIKNPKPKQENQEEVPRLTFQRISEFKRQTYKDQHPSYEQKQNKRFEPKREDSVQKRDQQELRRRQEEEQKKQNKAKQGTVRKQWTISAAEKYLQAKANTKKPIQKQTIKEKSPAKAKSQQKKQQIQTHQQKAEILQPTFLESLPFSPKLLIPIAILLIVATYLLFFQSSSHQADLPSFSRPKADKPSKVKSKSRN